MADTNELAYFAGFFDGEGSVAIYHKKYVVSLTNTDVRPLRRALDIWGGAISAQRVNELNVQQIWRWQIYGHASKSFLEAIRPFVMVKGEQIALYLEAMPFVPVSRGQKYVGDAKVQIGLRAVRLKELKRTANAGH